MPHRESLTESERLSLHAPASDERGIGAPLHVKLRGSTLIKPDFHRNGGNRQIAQQLASGQAPLSTDLRGIENLWDTAECL
jgi:hypothetical protein